MRLDSGRQQFMTQMRFSNYRCFLAVVILFFFTTLKSRAQSLEHIAEFSAAGGQVQFLPGGYVIKMEDGQKERYIYQDFKFQHFEGQMPLVLDNWTSFDWGSVDYLDQINRQDFDHGLAPFLQRAAKIKKILEIPLSGNKGKLVLICYTSKSQGKALTLNATDIFVTGVVDTETDIHKPSKFRKLWDGKLEEQSDYGDFIYEDIPNVGPFVLLYSTQSAGDSVDATLNVYRVAGNNSQSATPKSAVRFRSPKIQR